MSEGSLASFSQLSALKQRAVALKSEGQTHAKIAEQLRSEFKSSTTTKTVDKWLCPSGTLWPEYMTFNEQLADLALAEAQQYVRVYAAEAVTTLRELSQPPYTPKIRVAAARALASPLVSRIIRNMPSVTPEQPETASPGLLAEIAREQEIIRLGEEALTRRNNAIEVENV